MTHGAGGQKNFEEPQASLARAQEISTDIASEVLEELECRKGFRAWFDDCDGETQQDIIDCCRWAAFRVLTRRPQ